ncbi:restriction endonuclease subunit S [Aliivibrio salmonicida]|uniref:restriction endonuclease subunit S n=1 Tax=Aliivibrio salmonicida TaxID=40269 RepID=UPI00406C117D
MSNLVPIGWEIKNIESILDKVIDYRGKSPPKSNSGVPLITAKNIRKGFINEDPREYIPTEQFEKWMTKGLPENGDIFITTEAPLGNVARVPEYLFAIGQRVLTLRVKKNVVDSEFLLHVMQGREFREQLDLQSTGSTVAGIKQSTFRLMLLVLPPLPEQQKIAAILTSVDEVIENTQAQINKLKDLKTGMMQELLTRGVGVDGNPHTEFKDSPVGRIPKAWDVVTTGQVTKSIVPGRNKPKNLLGDIPWLTISDLDSFYVDKSKFNYGVTRNILSDAKGKTLPKDTVIMSVVGEFGVSSVARVEVVINQQLHGFVCSKQIDSSFLCLSLRYHKAQMEQLATQTTIAYMNKNNAESVLIALPSILEQRYIASSIMSVEKKINSISQSLLARKNLKKALMQDLLTGKVRVKVDS